MTTGTTLARTVRFFLKGAHRMPSGTAHAICNEYLVRLRSGSRRRTYGSLRQQVREVRARAAATLKASAS